MSGETERSVSFLVDHLFRRQAGVMIAGLVGRLGPAHLGSVEESVQETFVKALKIWPFHGVPENPEGWLWRTARNGVLDRTRRDRRLVSVDRVPEVEVTPEEPGVEPGDDTLRLIFLCCHPDLVPESRVALTLKLAMGFSVEEIARALLKQTATVAQRLVRAKRQLREMGVSFALPEPVDLMDRTASAYQVLYLVFNEGHSAHAGRRLVREELCSEAMRLLDLVLGHQQVASPEGHALAALFAFLAARFSARTDAIGLPLTLARQDRTRWDRGLMAKGLVHLARAGRGTRLSRYHLEAELASCHTLARSYGETDWARVLTLCDALIAGFSSPPIALERAIALAETAGPEVAAEALARLAPHADGYVPYHAARAEIARRLGRHREAADAFARAERLTESEPLRQYFSDHRESHR